MARFHRALGGWQRPFSFARAGVHDTPGHLAKLEAQIGHTLPADLDPRVPRVAEEILAEARRLPALPASLPLRVSHGDLKISNVLYDGTGAAPRAVALLDLDTMARMTIAYELGDAWRSWCNPLGEDAEETRFDLAIFEAAVSGYGRAAAGLLGVEERETIVAGLMTVSVELAARFCVDAFEDRYFGWNPARYPSRREHNRVRAAGQLCLARAVAARRAEAERLVERRLAV